MWGMRVGAKHYSDKAVKRLNEIIDERRTLFKQEYAFALDNRNDLWIGVRFKDNDTILWVLESNVPEYKFMLTPEICLDNVLLGAAEADYHYKFEKEW